MGWNAVDDEILGINIPSDNQEIGGGVQDDAALKSRFAKARAESGKSRSLWSHFIDTLTEGAVHSGLGAEPVARAGLKNRGYSAEQINQGEKRVIEGIQQRRAVREQNLKDVDTLSPANIGKWAVELGGNLLGGVDPTYVLAPGKNALTRVLSQAGINAGVDAFSQGQEVRRGIKDKFDPKQTAIAAGTGLVLQGGIESAKKIGNLYGRVTSTKRSAADNKRVGGVKNSYHLSGRAIDIARKKGVSHKQIENAYRRAGFDIIESLDEGDHSHLAFNFKKSKPTSEKWYVDDKPTTEAPNDFSDILNDPLTMHSIREQGQVPYITGDPNVDAQLREVILQEDSRLRENVVDISDRYISPEVREIMNPVYDDTPIRQDNNNPLKDLLTPAEIEDMPIQVRNELLQGAPVDRNPPVAPEARGALSEDILDSTLGRGTVATTPVNANGLPVMEPPARPAFPGEEGFEAGPGPKGGDDTPDSPPILSDEAKRIAAQVNPAAEAPVRRGMDAFVEALKKAKAATPEQNKLYKAERAKRFSEGRQRSKYTEGEEGLFAEKAALKGEMKKLDMEPLRDKLSKEDVTGIMEGIKASKKLSWIESVVARDSVKDMLDGILPTKGEIELLYRVHPELVDAVLGKKGLPDKLKSLMMQAYETTRGQMGSGDVSFTGRQGVMMWSRPEWWKASAKQFKALRPSQGQQVLDEQLERIVQNPHYERSKKAGIKHMDVGGHGNREEFAAHNLAERIPGLGQLPKGSNRAYTFMGNELRYGVFYDIVDKAQKAGVDVDDPAWLKALGDYINTFTGRAAFGKGTVGGALDKAMPALNLLLFAPRFVFSTFQRLNPLLWGRAAVADYKAGSPVILKNMMRDSAAYVGMMAGALSLANLAGFEVEWDPRSPTGLKIKRGNTTYDAGGGMVQTINLLSKIYSGTKISGKGNESSLKDAKYGEDTFTDTVARFVRTKLHPTLSYFWNMREGENVVGEKFDPLWDTIESVAPMYASTLADIIKEEGKEEGAFTVIPALFSAAFAAFGGGLSTYDPDKIGEPKAPKEEFKEAAPEESDEFDVTQWEF